MITEEELKEIEEYYVPVHSLNDPVARLVKAYRQQGEVIRELASLMKDIQLCCVMRCGKCSANIDNAVSKLNTEDVK